MAVPDENRNTDATPKAKVRKSRLHLSLVWIVPLIAAAVGGYLFYQTEIDVGPRIQIQFADGPEIKRGSRLVYRGVEVGSVQSVELDSKLDHVNVTAELHKSAAALAREGSQFWIVRPRVSVGEISGLDTLLSGSYIQVAPGAGADAQAFVGLTEPPVLTDGAQDLVIFVETDDASSLQIGSPVDYRGVEVGKIASITLPQESGRIQVELAIHRDRADLVRNNSLFWQSSGVHVDLAPLDPRINVSSLAALVRGGVSFATPQPEGAAVQPNAVFRLRDQRPRRAEIAPRPGVNLVLTASELGSLQVGDPVYYRGVRVGEVQNTSLTEDADAARVSAVVWDHYAPLVQEGTVFWNASGLRFRASLLSGVTLDLESLASLLGGGVAFATPDQQGTPAKDGSHFTLHPHPKSQWLKWQAIAELPEVHTTTTSERASGFVVQDLPPEPYDVTTASHMRTGPDTTYPVLATLDQGTTVEVTGKVEDHNWYRIKTGDAVGYVWSKLLEPATPSTQ
ncbi:MAG: MlaD family protein [Pseudomonadota bacterium]